MTKVNEVTSLEQLTDRQLLEIVFTSQVRLNKRLIDIENSLKKGQGLLENSKDYKTYLEYINDLYGSQYSIRQELDVYLASVNY